MGGEKEMKQLFFPVLFVCCLISCFQEQKADIVGEWYMEQMNSNGSVVREEIVFNDDGTYLWTRFLKEKAGSSVLDTDKGRYEVRIRYTHDSVAVPRIRFISEDRKVAAVTISYVVDSTTLTLIGEELNTLYTRVGETGGEK